MAPLAPRTFRTGLTISFPIVAFALVLAGIPGTASAQTGRESRWGVNVSFTPSWGLPDSLKELIVDEDDEVNVTGKEFTIGFVRGSTLGGDWGVSFVRKPFDDGSGGVGRSVDCFNARTDGVRPAHGDDRAAGCVPQRGRGSLVHPVRDDG